jgi:hypothetical protein
VRPHHTHEKAKIRGRLRRYDTVYSGIGRGTASSMDQLFIHNCIVTCITQFLTLSYFAGLIFAFPEVGVPCFQNFRSKNQIHAIMLRRSTVSKRNRRTTHASSTIVTSRELQAAHRAVAAETAAAAKKVDAAEAVSGVFAATAPENVKASEDCQEGCLDSTSQRVID